MTTGDPIGHFLAHAARDPARAAVDFGECIVSYAELEEKARRLAAAFHGVAEPRVLVALPQGPDAYAAMIAAILSGGYYVPVNVRAPSNKLVRLVALTEPNVIVADRALGVELAAASPAARIVDPARLAHGAIFEGEGVRHPIAYVMLTSGSTGTPKGVVISATALAHYIEWLHRSAAFRPGDRVSQFPNISFDLSVLDIYGALSAGATLVPPATTGDRLFPADFARRSRISVWVSVPSVFGLAMCGKQATAEMLGSVRLFAFCGEPLLYSHLAAIFEARPDASVMNLYGPTEATVSMTSVLLHAHDFADACADSVALGEPIAGMGLHLVGGGHPGEGEIVITGPQLATEYWREPERTAQAFRPVLIEGQRLRGYFTGDWGERRGRHVFFRRRIDTQVKINGYRVETGEIIARLSDCGWPVACVLKHGDALTAVVESPDAGRFDARALRSRLHDELEPHAVPAFIHAVESLPRNANDKIDEASVRAWLESSSPAALQTPSFSRAPAPPSPPPAARACAARPSDSR